MDEDLTTSLIIKYRKSNSNNTIGSSALLWQKSEELEVHPNPSPQKMKTSTKRVRRYQTWYGNQQKVGQRTLNDKFFNLSGKVQKTLYIINFIINIAIRIMFINLLVFLGLLNKWIYFIIFMSLEGTAVVIYFIVMVKMLFTRSDKESVYFQKIFNETEWADIESQRLMRTHFNLGRIVSKICVFFNPITKFKKNTKISFLRQELFKRMELVMVYLPFSIVFFLNPNNFISESKPNFNVYITAGIVLQSVRTAFTYLIVYTYN